MGVYEVALRTLLMPLLLAGSDKSCSDDDSAKNVSYQVWRMEEFPNPREHVQKCGRGKVSWICDPGKVLSDTEADRLDHLLEEIHKNTTCTCPDGCPETEDGRPAPGYNLAVAFVNEMHSEKTQPTEYEKLKATETFARHLQESSWNFGECDNDAVIVVSIDFKKAWTSSGNKFNAILSDWCVNHIYKQVRHSLWGGNYTEGLTQMVLKYGSVLRGEDPCKAGISAGRIIFILAFMSFGLCFVISIISFFKQRFKLCENRPVRV